MVRVLILALDTLAAALAWSPKTARALGTTRSDSISPPSPAKKKRLDRESMRHISVWARLQSRCVPTQLLAYAVRRWPLWGSAFSIRNSPPPKAR